MYQNKNLQLVGPHQISLGELVPQAPQELWPSVEDFGNRVGLLFNTTGDSCPIASDSTAVIDFAVVDNTRFSEQIIQGARTAYNLERLRALKGKSPDYLTEGAKQIYSLWHGIHALNIHTEMFTVLFLIAIGTVLLEIKESFERPHEFTRWRDRTFDPRHKRHFQAVTSISIKNQKLLLCRCMQ
jgi:hypothetical protein